MNTCCVDGSLCGTIECIPMKNGTEFEPKGSDKDIIFKRNTLTDLLKIFQDRDAPDPMWNVIRQGKKGELHVAIPKKV